MISPQAIWGTVYRAWCDIALCLVFFSRLSLPLPRAAAERPLARAIWAAPVAGIVIGAIAALVWTLAATVFPGSIAAALSLAVTLLLTGCLHEDGLADVADGFGGGRDPERKLAIMRDSRIGTYGVAALVMSVLLRWVVIGTFEDPHAAALALVAAHAGARAPIAIFMHLLPPARDDGLSAGAGRPGFIAALAALAIGGSVVLLALGDVAGQAAIIATAVCALFFARLCRRQIGGQTGDTVGALEQIGEIVILLAAGVVI